jgi:hypothetical protein
VLTRLFVISKLTFRSQILTPSSGFEENTAYIIVFRIRFVTFLVGSSLGLLLNSDVAGSMFLRNVGGLLWD